MEPQLMESIDLGRVMNVAKRLLIVLPMVLLAGVLAQQIAQNSFSVPHVFTAGEIISASDMNENFDAVASAINSLQVDAGVSTLNSLVGDVTIQGGSNVAVETSGNSVVINAVGGDGSGLTAVATDETLDGDGTPSSPLSLANASVTTSTLADGAVSASKTLDEPGVAQNIRGSYLALSLSAKTIEKVTIAVPAPGYVHVHGNLEIIGVNNHETARQELYVDFDIGTVPADLPTVSRSANVSCPAGSIGGLPGRPCYISASPSAVFPVASSGNYTFYLNARLDNETSLDIRSNVDATVATSIIATYVPSAYGTVESP